MKRKITTTCAAALSIGLFAGSASAQTAITLPDAGFAPEGVAADEDGALYTGSLTQGRIVKITPETGRSTRSLLNPIDQATRGLLLINIQRRNFMPAHVIILARPHPERTEDTARYAQAVQPLVTAAGANPIIRSPVSMTVASADAPSSGMVIEFQNHDAAKNFIAQEAYQTLIPSREKNFAAMEIHIVG